MILQNNCVKYFICSFFVLVLSHALADSLSCILEWGKMNVLDKYTSQVVSSSCKNTNSFKQDNKQIYKDPLRCWPMKGLAYSNELGAVVGEISPKLGTVLWVPALMYFGADIYDKYKNEDTSYNPSTKRGLKEAIFQTMASVIMPTAAVKAGQKAISNAQMFSKTGLTTQARQEVFEHSLAYMESTSLHTFVDNVAAYKEGFKNSILTLAQDTKGDFKTFKPSKKAFSVLNPLKKKNAFTFASEKKLVAFSEKQADKIFEMRADLMQNKCPKGMSKKLFKKFQNMQGEYQKIYPADKYMGKAAKSILKDWHNSQIFKNKMIKTAGGFIALALLAKPIDDFVEHIVIKKTVEPGLDYLSNGLKNRKTKN